MTQLKKEKKMVIKVELNEYLHESHKRLTDKKWKKIQQ